MQSSKNQKAERKERGWVGEQRSVFRRKLERERSEVDVGRKSTGPEPEPAGRKILTLILILILNLSGFDFCFILILMDSGSDSGIFWNSAVLAGLLNLMGTWLFSGHCPVGWS